MALRAWKRAGSPSLGNGIGITDPIEHLEIDLLTVERICDLTQVQGAPCQAIQTGHHQRITFPDIFQTGLEPGAFTPRTAFFLLKDFVAVLKCSGLQTKQLRLANKGLSGLTIIANKKAVRPTMIANEPTIIAKGLQTARWAHIH